MLKPGDKAPDFSLIGTEKQPVALADYKGRNLVLLFFPFAYSSTCTKELCMTRDDLTSYNDLGAEVLAVSVDSHHAQKQFQQDNQLNFKLASDFNKEAIHAYGVASERFGPGYKGVAKRSVFVIDSKGVIRHTEVLEDPGNIPDFEKVKAALRSIKAS